MNGRGEKATIPTNAIFVEDPTNFLNNTKLFPQQGGSTYSFSEIKIAAGK